MQSIESLLEESIVNGIITLECPKCHEEVITEPDAPGYCHACNCKVNNPLLDGGYI